MATIVSHREGINRVQIQYCAYLETKAEKWWLKAVLVLPFPEWALHCLIGVQWQQLKWHYRHRQTILQADRASNAIIWGLENWPERTAICWIRAEPAAGRWRIVLHSGVKRNYMRAKATGQRLSLKGIRK